MKLEEPKISIATESDRKKIIELATERMMELNIIQPRSYISDTNVIEDSITRGLCYFLETKNGYGFVSFFIEDNDYHLHIGFWSERNPFVAAIYILKTILFHFDATKTDFFLTYLSNRNNKEKYRSFVKNALIVKDGEFDGVGTRKTISDYLFFLEKRKRVLTGNIVTYECK